MSIKKYEILVKVVELGSLTKAAEASGCSQSAVSHILNDLEEEFGFSILKRSRGGVQLTENGARILPSIRGILNYNEQLNQTVASIRGLDTGVIRIGTVTSVAVHWLPGILKQFGINHPGIEFKLYNGDYGDVSRWLSEGSIDVGFLALPTDINCECIPLMEDRMLAVLPRDHPMANLPRFPVAQVQNESFISLLESSDQDTRRIMEAAGVTPNIKFTTKDDYAIIAMVEQGLGMSIMPELLLQNHTDNVVTMELVPKSSRLIGLAIPNVSRTSPATRSFADCVVEWIRNHY
ncbi:MAG: LysR family transcriptional regulator [Oscillospiraceae bacterium]|nr:LysR family transcriptional regulator [Oscillospiraceae bacterium]